MFNFKALFTASLLAATATTAWGKAEAVLFASSDCSGADNSGTIGMSTGVFHSTYIAFDSTGGYANSVHFYTDGVNELYYYSESPAAPSLDTTRVNVKFVDTEVNCEGSAHFTNNASVCINGLSEYRSFKKAA